MKTPVSHAHNYNERQGPLSTDVKLRSATAYRLYDGHYFSPIKAERTEC